MDEEQKGLRKQSRGARNLLIMGVLAIVIAIATTSVSLAIYHNSGDIYLDRSRPGFMPDEEEIEDENDKPAEEYDFSKTGKLSDEIIDEYLKNLEKEEADIKAFEKPFDGRVLSDEALGIPEEVVSEPET